MSPPTDLTTTRINRLLRPLRSSSLALFMHNASAPSNTTGPTGFVTYASRTSWRPAEKGPLALILPPDAIQAQHPSVRGGVRNIELSRKIYAVRNAFRNIVQAAYGSSAARRSIGKETKGVQRVLSLTAMCASVVGAGIQEEVDAQRDEGGEMGENEEDEEEMEIVNEMYDYVPSQYRKFVPFFHLTQNAQHLRCAKMDTGIPRALHCPPNLPPGPDPSFRPPRHHFGPSPCKRISSPPSRNPSRCHPVTINTYLSNTQAHPTIMPSCAHRLSQPTLRPMDCCKHSRWTFDVKGYCTWFY
jgi:hypothetical protein